MGISNLPDKHFKVIIIKTLKELGRRVDEHSEKINKGSENIKEDETEPKCAITNLKVY